MEWQKTDLLIVVFKTLSAIFVSVGIATDHWVRNDECHFGLFTLCYTNTTIVLSCNDVTVVLNEVSGK